MNDFLQYKEEWLVAVAANIHEWYPVAVATALSRYMNSKSEMAFPAVATLAEDLNGDRRHVQRALNRLIKEKFLICKHSHGRHSNKYQLSFPAKYYQAQSTAPDEARFKDHPTAPDQAPNRARRGPQPRLTGRTNLEEPRRTQEAPPASRTTSSQTGRRTAPQSRRPGHLIPTDWQPRAQQFSDAAQIANWDRARVEKERRKFITRNRDNGVLRRDWYGASAAQLWHSWCEWGLKIDTRNAAIDARNAVAANDQQYKPGVRRGIGGLSSFVKKQQQRAAAAEYVSDKDR